MRITEAQARQLEARSKAKPEPRRMGPAAKAIAEATRATYGPSSAPEPYNGPQFLEVEVPVRIQSVLNLRESKHTRMRRVIAERNAATRVLTSKLAYKDTLRWLSGQVLTVTLTRIAPRRITDEEENLRAGFKAVKDAVAAALRIDDGDPRLTWVYAPQEIGKKYAARIRIESTGAKP